MSSIDDILKKQSRVPIQVANSGFYVVPRPPLTTDRPEPNYGGVMKVSTSATATQVLQAVGAKEAHLRIEPTENGLPLVVPYLGDERQHFVDLISVPSDADIATYVYDFKMGYPRAKIGNPETLDGLFEFQLPHAGSVDLIDGFVFPMQPNALLNKGSYEDSTLNTTIRKTIVSGDAAVTFQFGYSFDRRGNPTMFKVTYTLHAALDADEVTSLDPKISYDSTKIMRKYRADETKITAELHIKPKDDTQIVTGYFGEAYKFDGKVHSDSIKFEVTGEGRNPTIFDPSDNRNKYKLNLDSALNYLVGVATGKKLFSFSDLAELRFLRLN